MLDKDSAKIIVLGDSGVGKTSLIYLICRSKVLNSPQWTIGCSIDIKLYDNYFLEFWDIGGSRSHKIARSFLYTNYHGVIAVFDSTNNKSRLNLNEWLQEVKYYDKDGDIPLITIGTRKDLLPSGTVLDSDDRYSVINFNNYPSERDIIYVNTQNVMTFSKDFDKLDRFFKNVINRRIRSIIR